MIKVEHLSKRFGDNVVLDNINFEIADGEVVSVIGPSGTGKSTLLRCINRLETPDAGSVNLDGKTVAAAQKKPHELEFLRQNTGMVFQKFNLFEKKTALENVMEGLVIVKKMPKEEARALARQELERVGMSAWANHYPRHLSGGQQQRVAIARAIAMKPKLLLLDEPTSALDPELVGEVLDVIKQLANDGFTMLLVSHEINFVKKVSDKIVFLEKGHIVEQGTPRQVFDNPQNERTREFLFKMNLLNEPEYTI